MAQKEVFYRRNSGRMSAQAAEMAEGADCSGGRQHVKLPLKVS
ncbi:hypothetical protein BN137_1632 [Cronobacter condimenti 1330]|uniref:Uncharacterized protein n=1 Tax=Cronobacter condimenti 1330 TaxID=1073999 RepID=K8ADC3_9ENTR|nr:hypothetical protein BN137_1632 [Cronobacter condimenti 1330]